MNKEKIIRGLNYCSMVIAIITIPVVIYLAAHGAGLTDGSFGPGAYYYSDIPGWEKIFLGENAIRLGFDHPIIGYGFFITWGLFLFQFLLWVDQGKIR